MLFKSSQKFFMAQGHQLLLFSICIILVSKADGGVGYLLYSVGGYGCFVRVLSLSIPVFVQARQKAHWHAHSIWVLKTVLWFFVRPLHLLFLSFAAPVNVAGFLKNRFCILFPFCFWGTGNYHWFFFLLPTSPLIALQPHRQECLRH